MERIGSSDCICGHLLTDPWDHVLAMGFGIMLANGVVHWEHELKQDMDKLIKKIQKANKKQFLGANPFYLYLSPFLPSLEFLHFPLNAFSFLMARHNHTINPIKKHTSDCILHEHNA